MSESQEKYRILHEVLENLTKIERRYIRLKMIVAARQRLLIGMVIFAVLKMRGMI